MINIHKYAYVHACGRRPVQVDKHVWVQFVLGTSCPKSQLSRPYYGRSSHIRDTNVHTLRYMYVIWWKRISFIIFIIAYQQIFASVSQQQLVASNNHFLYKNVSQIRNSRSDFIHNRPQRYTGTKHGVFEKHNCTTCIWHSNFWLDWHYM